MTAQLENVVVVGGSTAGHAAAERLRISGFAGRITVVGEERHRPYNRTPLSKQLLTSDYQIKHLALPAFADLQVTWRTGCRAIGVNTQERTVLLDGAEKLRYDGLVIANGVQPRVLPDSPMHSPRVHMLRTLADAYDIDQALGHSSKRVLIVGGGFIGCELASTCRRRGLDVTIIDSSPTILARALGNTLGAVIGDVHRRKGVRLHLGTAVVDWNDTGKDITIRLRDGEVLAGDTVVVGIGTVPRTEWLTGSALDITDGVLATPTCHAVGADDVVVAGDIARWPNLRFDAEPRRVEHWINAVEMGQAAADNLLAGPQNATPFRPVPRFWSEQHGVKIQSLGMPQLGPTLRVVEGSAASERMIATYTRPEPAGERLMGVIALDNASRLIDYAPLVGSLVTADVTVRAQDAALT